MELSEKNGSCPYCGETLSLLIDPTHSGEEYIEDCAVCCRPIRVFVTVTETGTPILRLLSENE